MAIQTTGSGLSSLVGSVIGGTISWFTGGLTASGVPASQPGIAVYNRSTLGGWWMVKMPNGVIAIVRQTDIGPAPWTGRTFDFTQSLIGLLGYSTSNFPTNATAHGVYLGQSETQASTGIGAALNALGATPQQAATIMSQGDAGAFGLHGATVAVDPSGQHVSSTAPTAIGSSAAPALGGGGCSLGPINMPQAFCTFFSEITSAGFWKLAAFYVAGAVLVFWGLRELAAGSKVSVLRVDRGGGL